MRDKSKGDVNKVNNVREKHKHSTLIGDSCLSPISQKVVLRSGCTDLPFKMQTPGVQLNYKQ